MTTIKKIGIVAGSVCIALGVLAFFGISLGGSTTHNAGATGFTTDVVQNSPWLFTSGFAAGSSQQFSVSSTGAITTSGAMVQSGGAASVAVFPGTLIANDLILGSGGYNPTYSTAVGTTFTVTPAQFCGATSILIPVGNTTTVTLTLPAATAAFTACGATAGSWSNQIVDNESSFAVTFATTSGEVTDSNILGYGGSRFFYASGTPAGAITYPPKIQASTTAMMNGIFTSTSSISYLLNQMSKGPTY